VPARGGGNSKRRQAAAAAASVGKRRPASAPLHALNGKAARAPGAGKVVPGRAAVGAKAAGGKAAAAAAAAAADPWAPTFAYDHNVVVANKRQYMALLAGSSDLFTAHSTFRNAARVAHRPPAGAHTEGVVAALRKNYAFLDGAKRENEQALPAAFHRYNPDKRAARPLEATRFHGLRNWDNEEPFFVKGVPFPECEVRSRAAAAAAAAAAADADADAADADADADADAAMLLCCYAMLCCGPRLHHCPPLPCVVTIACPPPCSSSPAVCPNRSPPLACRIGTSRSK